MTPGGTALVVRLDNAGDVLLAGPAIRAVAAGSERVTVLCGPAGKAAARLLPGVDDVVTWRAPWVGDDAPPLDPADVEGLVARLRRVAPDRALVLTSFHQSPLPAALLLRLAGVPFVAATSVDFPGTLLDVRHPVLDDAHEVEQALSLAAAAGYALPPGDDGRLAVRGPLPAWRPAEEPYVVVHPGASVPARGIPADRAAALVAMLAEQGRPVAVTGTAAEAALTARVAGRSGIDLGGAVDLAGLAGVLAGAAVVVTGNTGPAHLAAAVGTPVVSVFAPVVAPARWRPWGVPSIVLGRLDIDCAGCRSRTCPIPGQPCLDPASPAAMAAAVDRLARARTGVPA